MSTQYLVEVYRYASEIVSGRCFRNRKLFSGETKKQGFLKNGQPLPKALAEPLPKSEAAFDFERLKYPSSRPAYSCEIHPCTGYAVHDFPREKRKIDVIIDVSRIGRKSHVIENKQVRDER
jgi:hypothetical protein